MYTLYKHTTKSGKVYIGITSRKPEYRWRNGKAYKNNKYFYNAILKYGGNNIKHEILLTGLSKEKAEWWEKKLIKSISVMIEDMDIIEPPGVNSEDQFL